MASRIRDDRFYRRGMVLGLTLAEVMLLLLFILLLALSALFERELQVTESLRQELANRTSQIQLIIDKLEKLAKTDNADQSFEDTFRELIVASGENVNLKKQVAALTEDKQKLSQENERLKQAVADIHDIQETLRQSLGKNVSTKQMAEALAEAQQNGEIAQAVEEAGLPKNPEGLRETLKNLAAAQDELHGLAQANKELKDQVGYFKRLSGGKSNEMPPCWIHPETKRSEYIFDVVLGSDGLIVYDRDLPHRRAERAELPLSKIIYEQPLLPEEFLASTRALFELSEERECRFYVRVFDRTSATEKAIYKQRLDTVEGHFYKRVVRDGAVKPGSAAL
jgi:cell shape-determining protein MreC